MNTLNSLGIVACLAVSSTFSLHAVAAAEEGVGGVDQGRLLNAAATPEDWLTYGGTYDEQRFSRLRGIDKNNVAELGVAWSYDLSTSRGVEATPIVVDGVMYLTGAWSIVYALDAKTGEELWVYDPEVSGEDAAKGCCDVVNRGVAVADGKVFVGVFDGRLEALDAATGEVTWSTVTVDQSKPYTITGAPRLVNGNVLIGNGGGELGVRGYVSAYDIKSGELSWRFYTVPNPEKKPDGAASDPIFAELANDTWGDTGAWTTDGGGGTVWDAIVYDDVNNTVLIGVGNSSPWNSKIRDPEGNGDNFFVSSIVAVDADTGEYQWHFQTTPRDQFDYTATQTIILADLPIGEGGADRRVVMQAPKNGFYYVLDAATGEFLSGEAIVPMTWATGLDENGRPIENPDARKTDGDGFLLVPSNSGAHNWHPMSYSPQTGLAYIPAHRNGILVQDEPETATKNGRYNLGYNMAAGQPLTYPAGTLDYIRQGQGSMLIAWDPVAQAERWRVEHLPPYNGGTLITASDIVFQGVMKGILYAFDAENGDVLWSSNVKSGIAASPSTYEVDGEQYVAIATGWGTDWGLVGSLYFDEAIVPDVGRVVAFKVGGDGEVPDPPEAYVETTPKGEAFGDESMLAYGLQRFAENCMVCHGPLAISSGVLPDLRWSYITADADSWSGVVLDGDLTDAGMISFSDAITPEEAEAIRAYVLNQAWMAVANGDAQAPEE